VQTDAYVRQAPERFDLRYVARVMRVVSAAEFKVKYQDSALGYVWTVAKPLAWLAVLYVVFGRFFQLRATFENYTIYLLVGLVLWVFFLDATNLSLESFVSRAGVLRRLAIPRIVIPLSASLTTVLTLAVNVVALAVVMAVVRVEPRWSWLLVPFPVAELIVFTAAVALFLATLFVRARDAGPVWEIFSQFLFFATPIIYPAGFLPVWAQKIAFANPLVQSMQDVRYLLSPEHEVFTAADVYGSAWGYLIPFATLVLVVAAAAALYRREAPYLAERA
jgi:ABC-2 type transport system permease protein